MFPRVQKFFQWLSYKTIGNRFAKYYYKVYGLYARVAGYSDYLQWKLKGRKMIKIGIVGDLSMQDPDRLDKVMAAAMVDSDIVINVGDVHPGYEVMKKYLKSGKVLVVPGNHDEKFSLMETERQWFQEYDHFVLVGVDNSQDELDLQAWDLLDKAEKAIEKNKKKFLFVVAHKPLSSIILPDGSANNHIMGHGKNNNIGKELAHKFRHWLSKQKNVLLIVGHYHSWTYMRTRYADVLVEGRGGAAPECGLTKIIVEPDGYVVNKIDLD